MLGQHINLWQGTHKGILESKNTFLPSTHKGWGLSLSLQFSSQYPWDFQFHGKIPSSISMSDKIDPLSFQIELACFEHVYICIKST